MKKKIVILLTTFTMAAFSATAMAEGTLTAETNSVYIFDGKDSGWFYAKIENTGDAPIIFDNSKLALFSDKDELISSEDYIESYPSNMVVQPGEYVYASAFLWDSALEGASIGDIKYSIQAGEKGKEIIKIPCEASFEINGTDSYDNYIYVTITNETGETVYDYYVTAALTDAEGNVCFVDKQNLNTLGVGPNSTITLKMYIDNDIVSYHNTHGIVPENIDVMVCTVVE